MMLDFFRSLAWPGAVSAEEYAEVITTSFQIAARAEDHRREALEARQQRDAAHADAAFAWEQVLALQSELNDVDSAALLLAKIDFVCQAYQQRVAMLDRELAEAVAYREQLEAEVARLHNPPRDASGKFTRLRQNPETD